MAADRAKTATVFIARLTTNRVLLPMLHNMVQQHGLTKDEQQHQTDRTPARTLKAIPSRVARRFRIRQ
jgi:hypothetical protein